MGKQPEVRNLAVTPTQPISVFLFLYEHVNDIEMKRIFDALKTKYGDREFSLKTMVAKHDQLLPKLNDDGSVEYSDVSNELIENIEILKRNPGSIFLFLHHGTEANDPSMPMVDGSVTAPMLSAHGLHGDLNFMEINYLLCDVQEGVQAELFSGHISDNAENFMIKAMNGVRRVYDIPLVPNFSEDDFIQSKKLIIETCTKRINDLKLGQDDIEIQSLKEKIYLADMAIRNVHMITGGIGASYCERVDPRVPDFPDKYNKIFKPENEKDASETMFLNTTHFIKYNDSEISNPVVPDHPNPSSSVKTQEVAVVQEFLDCQQLAVQTKRTLSRENRTRLGSNSRLNAGTGSRYRGPT